MSIEENRAKLVTELTDTFQSMLDYGCTAADLAERTVVLLDYSVAETYVMIKAKMEEAGIKLTKEGKHVCGI
jgi:hypothetical protein